MLNESYHGDQGVVQLAEIVDRECRRIAWAECLRCSKDGLKPENAAASAINKITQTFASLHARSGITRDLIKDHAREWIENTTGEDFSDHHFDLAWRHGVGAAKYRDGRILAGFEKIHEPTPLEVEVDAITGYVGVTIAEISMRTTLAKRVLADIEFGPCNYSGQPDMMMSAGWSWAEVVRQPAITEEIKPFIRLAVTRYPDDEGLEEKTLRSLFQEGFDVWMGCGGVVEPYKPVAKELLSLPAGAVVSFPLLQRGEPHPVEAEKPKKAAKRASRTEKLAADWEARFGGNGS